MFQAIHLQNFPSESLWVDPVDKGIITSGYGDRTNPIYGGSEVHKGMDIAVPLNTEVRAVKAGEVTKTGYSNSYGNYIGYHTYDGYDIFYAHLNSIKAKKGDVVSQGEVIAFSGSTGSSTGPHLHYEVEYNGNILNPAEYVSLN